MLYAICNAHDLLCNIDFLKFIGILESIHNLRDENKRKIHFHAQA